MPRRNLPRTVAVAALLGVLLAAAPAVRSAAAMQAAAPDAAVTAADAWRLCAVEIDRVEREQHIPNLLLSAISTVESGRWNGAEQAVFAWPWTVMAEGRGRYLPTKAAAIAEVRKLRKAGVENIDVGCMQVNLHYHPDAFASLEQAFDPAANVAYAAQFLKSLQTAMRSWVKAVAHYHSATPALHLDYRNKVFAAWRTERRRAIAARMEERAAERAGQLAELGFGRAGPVDPGDDS